MIVDSSLSSVVSSSSVSQPAETILPNSNSFTTVTPFAVQPDYSNWITKPLNNYTVTEGLLLLLVICAFAAVVIKLFDI